MGNDEREIYSNSAEKRIDNELSHIEKEGRKGDFSEEYDTDDHYTDGYSSGIDDDDKFQTRVYSLINQSNDSDYAPFAPDDIDEYGHEKSKKHRKLFTVIITCGAILITAAVVFLALTLGKSCSNGSANKPTNATGSSDPTAPSVATAAKTEVPDVLGQTEESAASMLEQQGFKVSIIRQSSETVDAGPVIDQNPKPGEMAENGSTVTLSVSIGAQDETEPETEPETEEPTEAETETETSSQEKTISTYILPESASRYLDYDDLADIDGSNLTLARNEIYARHGRRFDSQEIQDYFDKCTWYNGTIEPDAFDESQLNQFERANIDFILQKEYSSMGN